jgi:hypothetical protein
MGQTLSEPVTNKETAICQDDNYKVNFFFRLMTHPRAISFWAPWKIIALLQIYNPPEPVKKLRITKKMFFRSRWAHRACKAGEHRWKIRTLTSSHFPTIPKQLGSVFTVRKREKKMSKSIE